MSRGLVPNGQCCAGGGKTLRALLFLLCALLPRLQAEDRIRLEVPPPAKLLTLGDVLQTSGRGSLVYGEWRLGADLIRLDRAQGDLWMAGDVLVEGRSCRLRTPYVWYNNRTREGGTGPLEGDVRSSWLPSYLEEAAEGGVPPRFVIRSLGARITRNVFGKFKVVFLAPSLTDCEHVPPLHDLAASSATFSAGEKVEAWNLRPRMFGVPYFYLPWAIHDLQYPWPWTSWQLGNQADWGPWAGVRTHLLPGKLAKQSVVGVEYRQKRGPALKQDWRRQDDRMVDSVKTHLYHEEWRSRSGGGPVVEQDRLRADLYHRQKIDPCWSAVVDAHHLTPRREAFWSDGGRRELSPNLYAPPFPGAKQEREGLLREYYLEEYRTGRVLQNALTLEYGRGRSFASLSTDRLSDEETPTSPTRMVELKGRNLPVPLADTAFLYSNEYSLGRMGLHVGRELSGEDKAFLFGRQDPPDFLSGRAYYQQKVERHVGFGPYLQVTPYVGSRSVDYEKVLRAKGVAAWNAGEADLREPWEDNHRFISGSLLSSLATGYIPGDEYDLKHEVRPSAAFDFVSPSCFNRDFLPARVDGVDEALNPWFKHTWRLDNALFVRRAPAAPRQLYTSTLEYVFLARHADNLMAYGPALKDGTNAGLSQSVFPFSWLRLSSDLRYNTFWDTLLESRSGLELKPSPAFSLSWNLAHLRDPLGPSRDRHDVDLDLRFPSRTGVRLRASYDPDPPEPVRAGLYRQGFRTVDFTLTQIYHSLKAEVQLAYDVESSGATLLFRLGPRLLGRNMPAYRRGL